MKPKADRDFAASAPKANVWPSVTPGPSSQHLSPISPQSCCSACVRVYVHTHTLYPASTIGLGTPNGSQSHLLLPFLSAVPAVIQLLTPALSPPNGQRKRVISQALCKGPSWNELTTARQVECPTGILRAWWPGISEEGPGGPEILGLFSRSAQGFSPLGSRTV